MTKPAFTPSISLGNIITILMALAAFGASFTVTKQQTSTNAARIIDMEGRLRVVEAQSTRQTTQMEGVAKQIEEIRVEQRQTNALLRELLTRVGVTGK